MLYSRQVRVWNEFAIPVPPLPHVRSNLGTMASFVRITPGEVHGESKRRDDCTASRRASTMHCCVAVSFNVLPAQRVSFDVLPAQRVHPWDCISDGFVLTRDNQSLTDSRWVSMCHQHRFIILKISLSWTRWVIWRDDWDETMTNSWLPPVVQRCDNGMRRQQQQRRREGGFIVNRNDSDDGGVGLGIRLRWRAEQGRWPISTSDLA